MVRLNKKDEVWLSQAPKGTERVIYYAPNGFKKFHLQRKLKKMSIEEVKSNFVVFTKIGSPNTRVTVNLANVLYSSGVTGNVTLNLTNSATLNVLEAIEDAVGGP